MTATIDDALDRGFHPGIWLRRTQILSSASKLGGLPWLPNGLAWPRHPHSKAPLHFLAQIDLSSLPQTPLEAGQPRLPRTGMLFFFADMDETLLWDDDEVHPPGDSHRSTRVLYAPAHGRAGNEPADRPPQIGHVLGEDGGGRARGPRFFPEAPLAAHVIETFVGCRAVAPDLYTEAADRRTAASIERITGETIVVVQDAPGGLTESPSIYRREGVDHSGRRWGRTHVVRHQMLGAPMSAHGFADQQLGLSDVICLIQIDTDQALTHQFSFGRGNQPAHFWIERKDLENGRFDRAYATTA